MSDQNAASLRLAPRHWRVLDALVAAGDVFVLQNRLPDGNGRYGCATGVTMRDLRGAGFVIYGREPEHSLNGYKITDAGRAVQAPKMLQHTEVAAKEP